MNDNNLNIVSVIMAGGVGTRFWPLSTKEKPKQFLKLFGNRSLLQTSYDRVAGIVSDERIIVLTNEGFTDLVREQLPEIPPENVIGEPMRRDTAAAVCLGALIVRKRFGNPVIVTLTADHLIEPVDLFQQTILSAARMAVETGALYTFGIEPTYPATGYGYLEIGEKAHDSDGIAHFHLVTFKEKPDLKTAQSYIDSGRYLWNSGMFVWTADTIIKEIKTHLPAPLDLLTKALEQEGAPGWQDALRRAFEPLEAISIDYAVMEKAADVRCVAGKFVWRDVGNWLAIQNYLSTDGNGNYYHGRLHSLDATGNLVFCENQDEIIVMVGVSDIVAVRAGHKTLIARKNRLEEVKQVVESMILNP